MRTALLLAALLLPLQIVPPGSGILVQGILTRDGTSEPIASAQMTLIAANPVSADPPARAAAPRPPVLQFTAVTDERGRFEMKGVPPGRYGLRPQKDGYFTVPPNPIATVIVGGALPVMEVKISMIRSAVLTGHVRDSAGNPMVNATVEVMTMAIVGFPRLGSAANASTDDRGQYTVLGLRPDINYYVAVDLPDKTASQTNAANRAQTTRATTYSRTQVFYPDVLEPAMAQPVVLGKDIERTSLEWNVHIPQAFRISGNLILPPGITPGSLPAPTFYLVRKGLQLEPQPMTRNSAVLSTTNEFELRDVLPGSYDLFVRWGMRPNQSLVKTGVEVRDRDITDFAVTLKQGSDITVRVVSNEPGFAIPDGASLTLISPEIPADALSGISLRTLKDASGSLAISNVPDGRYEIRPTGFPADLYIRDIRSGSSSVLDTGLVVDGQSQIIQVVIARGVGNIRGNVVDANGKQFLNARIFLAPSIAQRHRSDLHRGANGNSLSEFTVANIPPGEYKIFAFDGRSQENVSDSAVRDRIESRGTTVIVKAGDNLTVQVPVILKSGR